MSELRRFKEQHRYQLENKCIVAVEIDELQALIKYAEIIEKDAQRYCWLFDARTEDEVDRYSTTIVNPLPQDFVLSELQCFYTTKAQVDKMIDSQMEGGNET